MLNVYTTFRHFFRPLYPALSLRFFFRLIYSNKYILSTRLSAPFPSPFTFLSVKLLSPYISYSNKCVLHTRLPVPFSRPLTLIFRYTSFSVYLLLINAYCLPAFSSLFPSLFCVFSVTLLFPVHLIPLNSIAYPTFPSLCRPFSYLPFTGF
jgi:hypothetical protein